MTTGDRGRDGWWNRSGDNRRLRYGLLTAWGWHCHYCNDPLTMVAAEIDHIIPKSTPAEEIPALVADYGLADDFALNYAHNLAPICRDCNGPGKKGNRARALKTGTAAGDLLEKAAALSPRVVEVAARLDDAGAMTRGLVAVAEADPHDSKLRRVLDDLLPGVVAVAARYKPELLDYAAAKRIDIEGAASAQMLLDAESRDVCRWVQMLGIDLGTEVLAPILTYLASEITPALMEGFESIEVVPICEVEVDPCEVDLDFEFIQLRFAYIDGNRFVVNVEGYVGASASTHITAMGLNGDSGRTEQADGDIQSWFTSKVFIVLTEDDDRPTVEFDDDVQEDRSPVSVSCGLIPVWWDDRDDYRVE